MQLNELPTTQTGLFLPPKGYANWDLPVNENFKKITDYMVANDTALDNKLDRVTPQLNPFAFAPGWSAYGYGTCFWKSQEGVVSFLLNGVKDTPIVEGEVICELPVGYRAPFHLSPTYIVGATSNFLGIGHVAINYTDGKVMIFMPTGHTFSDDAYYIHTSLTYIPIG